MVVTKMARLNPFIEREKEFKERNLGKIILFCEGHTETNYFKYFSDIINKGGRKYSHIEIVPILADGNAQRVLNYAQDYLSDDSNLRKYSYYDKYLIFDCDNPPDIQGVITSMLDARIYILLPSNLLFETWLLMHYEDVTTSLSKAATYRRLATALGIEYYGDSEKASEGIIRQIIHNGDNVRMAISNARRLEKSYVDQGLIMKNDIKRMNPYTLVYTLVEQILIEMHNAQ
jgi:hypothetical protein